MKIKISIILPVLIPPAPASVPLLSSRFLLRFLEPPSQRPLQQRSHSFRASLTDLKAGALPTLPGQHNDSLCSREITTKPMACSYCWRDLGGYLEWGAHLLDTVRDFPGVAFVYTTHLMKQTLDETQKPKH